MLRCACEIVADVSKDRDAFVFMDLGTQQLKG
jgi:hypothetical protein